MARVLLPMHRFHPMDRDTDLLLPLSVQDWLSKDHLARDVVEVVEGLDLSVLVQAYGGTGSTPYHPAPYHPAMLLALLIYGYATGRFSSRKIERATYDALAFRFIACNLHPDHDTLATFRRRFRKEFEAAFVQVLEVAWENRFSRFGSVCLAGTKIHANASRHSALSYGHAETLKAHLRAEVQALLALAKRTDGAQVPDGMSIPAELERLALITSPPKAGRPMWVFSRKTMFCKGAEAQGLSKVGGIMIKAGASRGASGGDCRRQDQDCGASLRVLRA